MRARAVVLAVALVLAPLGARAADLVVWWEKGSIPQEDEALREIIAAFEQKTGKQVELVFYPQDELLEQTRGGARGRAAARLRLRRCADMSDYRAMGLRGSAGRPHGRRSGPSRTCSIRMRSTASTLLERQDRPARPLRAADGPREQPRPCLERACWSAPGFTPRGHPEGVGGVLVASGATRCSRRCARRLGRDDIWAVGLPCRPRRATRSRRVLSVPGRLRRGLRDPRRPARDRRSGGPAQADQGDRRLHGDLAQGLHAAGLGRAGTTIGNNKAFLAQTVVMTLESRRSRSRTR